MGKLHCTCRPDLADGVDVRMRCSPPPGSPVQWGLTQVACAALDSQVNVTWARFWLNATGVGGGGGREGGRCRRPRRPVLRVVRRAAQHGP